MEKTLPRHDGLCIMVFDGFFLLNLERLNGVKGDWVIRLLEYGVPPTPCAKIGDGRFTAGPFADSQVGRRGDVHRAEERGDEEKLQERHARSSHPSLCVKLRHVRKEHDNKKNRGSSVDHSNSHEKQIFKP